jgi:hypothetical protein
MKKPRWQDFLTQTKTRAYLISNPDHEIRKIKIRTQHMQNKSPARFYCKKGIKQGYDKKTYPKLMLNILKVMRNFNSIYTY